MNSRTVLRETTSLYSYLITVRCFPQRYVMHTAFNSSSVTQMKENFVFSWKKNSFRKQEKLFDKTENRMLKNLFPKKCQSLTYGAKHAYNACFRTTTHLSHAVVRSTIQGFRTGALDEFFRISTEHNDLFNQRHYCFQTLQWRIQTWLTIQGCTEVHAEQKTAVGLHLSIP